MLHPQRGHVLQNKVKALFSIPVWHFQRHKHSDVAQIKLHSDSNEVNVGVSI